MDWYPLFLIFSFIVLKSIGFLMIMEQPGAIKSVTGNEKKELGSFLLRYEKTFLCFDFIIKNILSLELNRKEQTRLKRNQKHKARNGLCQHSLSLLKAGKIPQQNPYTRKVLQTYFRSQFYSLITICIPQKNVFYF